MLLASIEKNRPTLRFPHRETSRVDLFDIARKESCLYFKIL